MNEAIIKEAVSSLYTISDLLRWAFSRFNEADLWYGHGTDNPWDEARQLVLPSLNLPLDLPESFYNTRLTPTERQQVIERIIQRITTKVPVAYLTNKAWFCGHEFYVDERVLVPRSPIGELINHRFAGLINRTPARILDMCTGSGCIAIACAYAFPDADIDAVDISAQALAVAEFNIEQHDKLQQVTPLASDLFRDLPALQYDLIVSNPPYVDAEDMADLPTEYRHEPELGLAAGNDGLILVQSMLAQAADYLSDEGIFICEVGNSLVHLIEQYPEVPFTWLSFKQGGEGVFMLERKQLLAAQHLFVEKKPCNEPSVEF